MRYAIIENGAVKNIVEADADFAAARGWIEAGNAKKGDLYENGQFTTPPAPPPEVPAKVQMNQARKALIRAGHSIADVDAAIAAIADPVQRELAKTDWEYSATVHRNSGLVASLAPALNLDSDAVDALFIQAEKEQPL